MRSRVLSSVCGVVFVITCLLASPYSTRAGGQVGEVAPDFTFTSLDGGTYSLHDYRGKVVFLNFFGYN
jgi:peroxiredoxin